LNWEDALDEIESLEFAAYASIASSTDVLTRILKDSEAVQDIYIELTIPGKVDNLASRAYRLTQEQVDLRYRHRWDIALATYVWLLGHHSPEHTRLLSQTIKVTPRCWWAEQMANVPPITRYSLRDTKDEPRRLTAPSVTLITESDSGDQIVSPVHPPIRTGYPVMFIGYSAGSSTKDEVVELFFVMAGDLNRISAHSDSPVPSLMVLQ